MRNAEMHLELKKVKMNILNQSKLLFSSRSQDDRKPSELVCLQSLKVQTGSLLTKVRQYQAEGHELSTMPPPPDDLMSVSSAGLPSITGASSSSEAKLRSASLKVARG